MGMFCRDGFSATGGIDLNGAKIGGWLDLTRAMLTNPDGYALIAQNLTVDQNMFCSDGFSATGRVDLNGATIGGWLNMVGATLKLPATATPGERTVVNCQELTCGRLTLPSQMPGIADLRQARIGVLAIPRSALTAPMRLSGLTGSVALAVGKI
jgi:hypothetical protein